MIPSMHRGWFARLATSRRRLFGPPLPAIVRSVRAKGIIDDYDSKSGCRRAVDEYFAQHSTGYRFVRRARLHVERG